MAINPIRLRVSATRASSIVVPSREELSLNLTRKEVKARLLKPVGKRVAFNYPGGQGNRRGYLRDRAIVWSGHSPSGADYWDVVDLIEFPTAKHRDWIRIGYYRQVGDKLRWGSQTTITEPVHTMVRLLGQAAKQKQWFRKILVSAAAIGKR
jgi:hypothetical protein